MCDVPPLLKLSCSDSTLNEAVLRTASVFIGISPFVRYGLLYLYGQSHPPNPFG